MSDRARHEEWAFTALRIIVGVMLACHGFSKLFGVFGHPVPIASQMGLGGIIELAGGVLVALGLFTRIAAFVVSGEMAVAYFQFHWKLDLSHWKFLPLVNQGELAVAYCFVFLFICAYGPGPISLDRKLRGA